MTNNELLHASLLDIVFDNRNKEYGAYALRKEYNQRLLISLGLGLSLILFLVLMNTLNGKEQNSAGGQPGKNEVILTLVELPEEKIKKPDPPATKPLPPIPKSATPIAAIQFPPVVIVPDDEADPDPVASQEDMSNKEIATANAEGKDFTGVAGTDNPIVSSVDHGKEPVSANQPLLANSSPEFPGGQEALMKFLSRYLDTPDELENGEKKMVRARFKVDSDGLVSLVEIVQSGGDLFDKEVIRVCKKMPRWKPAIQNGVPVPMSYVLPVTFISSDQ